MILFDFLRENQMAQAGVATMATGALLAALRFVPSYLWGFSTARFAPSLVVESTDPNYMAVASWAMANMKMVVPREFSVSNASSAGLGVNVSAQPGYVGARASDHEDIITPVSAIMVGAFRGFPVILFASRRSVEHGSAGAPMYVNSMRMMFAFASHKTISEFNAFATDVFSKESARRKKLTCFRSNTTYGGWGAVANVGQRSSDSVILADGIKQSLLDDARRFVDSRDWYASVGVPYRRGYLLYGPPGNGKSSMCLAMASDLGLPVYIMSLSAVNDDTALNDSLNNMASPSILVIEDIDCVGVQVDRDAGPLAIGNPNAGPRRGITLAGLLGAIDGVGASEGRILIVTTNNRDALDPALIRSGRIDVQVLIENADVEQVRKMADRFGACVSQDDVDSLVGKPMSDVQEFMLARVSR